LGNLFFFAADIPSIQLPGAARLSPVSGGWVAERSLNELGPKHHEELRIERKDAVRKLAISAAGSESADQLHDLGAVDVLAQI
jgi:hypothetical protein